MNASCTFYLILFITISFAEQTILKTISVQFPNYFYPINVKEGEFIKVDCNYEFPADMDLYLYQEGTNLLNTAESVAYALSGSYYNETLYFTSKINGSYYLQASPFYFLDSKEFEIIITVAGT